MEAMELTAIKNSLIAIITQTNDKSLLDRMLRLAQHPTAIALTEESEITKEEILSDFDQACKELKLSLEGKKQLRTIDEALNEL